jgi:hypothetical protein
MLSGEIYRHEQFYIDRETGEFKPKYFIVLATTPSEDIIARLLTSRSHGRRENPPCFHGDPYPGYFLGVPGDPLAHKSWVDLRKFDDLDGLTLQRDQKRNLIRLATALADSVLFAVMECVANAADTTNMQSRIFLDTLSTLRNS